MIERIFELLDCILFLLASTLAPYAFFRALWCIGKGIELTLF